MAQTYRNTFDRARAERRHFSPGDFAVKPLDKRPGELPPLKLNHLHNMTDATGMLQHALFTVPNYSEGYTTDDNARARYCKKQDAEVILLKSSNAPPAYLYLSPRNRSTLPKGVAIEPLLRVVELGMDVCALRAGAHKSGTHEQADELAGFRRFVLTG